MDALRHVATFSGHDTQRVGAGRAQSGSVRHRLRERGLAGGEQRLALVTVGPRARSVRPSALTAASRKVGSKGWTRFGRGGHRDHSVCPDSLSYPGRSGLHADRGYADGRRRWCCTIREHDLGGCEFGARLRGGPGRWPHPAHGHDDRRHRCRRRHQRQTRAYLAATRPPVPGRARRPAEAGAGRGLLRAASNDHCRRARQRPNPVYQHPKRHAGHARDGAVGTQPRLRPALRRITGRSRRGR